MKKRARLSQAMCLLVAGLVVGGCSKNKNEAEEPMVAGESDPAVGVDGAAPDPEWDDAKAQGPNIQVTLVVLDVALSEACSLSNESGEVAFDFDSAALSDDAKDKLSRVADCLNGGEMASRKLMVVGSASPPGDDEYNDELSKERADAVRTALIDGGVAESRIETRGRGEVPDLPETPAGNDAKYPENRRVDLILVK